MTKKLEQPARRPTDGQVEIQRMDKTTLGDDMINIRVMTGGEEHFLTCSPFNAWRVFGMLSLMLGIPLPAATGKAIKIG